MPLEGTNARCFGPVASSHALGPPASLSPSHINLQTLGQLLTALERQQDHRGSTDTQHADPASLEETHSEWLGPAGGPRDPEPPPLTAIPPLKIRLRFLDLSQKRKARGCSQDSAP